MGNYLAIKITPTEMKHFKVSAEVYIYVNQLEYALRTGSKTRKALEKLYPGRFAPVGKED